MVDAVANVAAETQVEDFCSEVCEARSSAGLRRLQRARGPDDVGAAGASMIVLILIFPGVSLAGSMIGLAVILGIWFRRRTIRWSY